MSEEETQIVEQDVPVKGKRKKEKDKRPQFKSFEEAAGHIINTHKAFSDTVFTDSGSVSMNLVLSGKLSDGGIPVGKFISFAAKSGSGKTTIAVEMCRSLCSLDKKTVYIDAEGALNDMLKEGVGLFEYDTANGGKNFVHAVTPTFKGAQDVVDAVIAFADFIVIDSVTALIPTQLLEGNIEDCLPGIQARLVSLFMQKYKVPALQKGCTFLFIQQMRTKLNFKGVSTEAAAGGNALQFFPDIRLEMKTDEDIYDESGIVVGAQNTVWSNKNKFSPPYRPYPIAVLFGKGVSNIRTLSAFLEDSTICEKAGSYFKLKVPGCPEETVQGHIGVEGFVKKYKDQVIKELTPLITPK